MHIAHVGVSDIAVTHRYGGAIQRRIFEVAREQARRGHSVTIYSLGHEPERREFSGVNVHFLKCSTPLPWRHLEFQLHVARYLRRSANELDVVYFHSQPEGALLNNRRRPKSFLWYDFYHFRRSHLRLFYHSCRYCLSKFDLLLPVSTYCKFVSQPYWNLPPEKFAVVYNGVNLVQFRPDGCKSLLLRKKLRISKRVLLYVGRLCRQKGTDVLLEAMRRLNSRRSDLQLVAAGPIEHFGNKADPEKWSQQMHEAGAIYLGPVEEDELSAVYNLADVFVMPTRELEMFGMAAVEAQACGKPVVASDHGGLKETVPETCGLRFPVGDPKALANEVERLLDDPGLYGRCARNAIANASTYNWNNICDRLEELYSRDH
jgi:glycosyltransferase involved in cell wall biosynthesis